MSTLKQIVEGGYCIGCGVCNIVSRWYQRIQGRNAFW